MGGTHIAYVYIIEREYPVHVQSNRRQSAAPSPALSAGRTCPGDDPCDRCAPSSSLDVDVQARASPATAVEVLAGGHTRHQLVTYHIGQTRISPVFLKHTSLRLLEHCCVIKRNCYCYETENNTLPHTPSTNAGLSTDACMQPDSI